VNPWNRNHYTLVGLPRYLQICHDYVLLQNELAAALANQEVVETWLVEGVPSSLLYQPEEKITSENNLHQIVNLHKREADK